MATKSIVVNLELGHKANVKYQKTSEGFTHDWEVFVQGVEGLPIEHYVEKVVFYLHESFSNPQRVIKSPPFFVKEKGYGGFILPIEVYFKATDDHHRKTKINYDLFLQSVDSSPIHHTIKEKITFFKPKDEFRKLLLLGGAIEETIPEDSKKSSQSSVSRPASGGKTKPRYDSNGASRHEQGDNSMRKSKDSIGKLDSNRHRDKSKESSRVRQSSQKTESSRSKESAKPKEPYVKEKKESSKQRHKEQTSKSSESSDRMKGGFTKQKEQHKPKEVRAPDAFSELFGEIIRKGETHIAPQHKSDKSVPKNQPKGHGHNPPDPNPSKGGKSKNKNDKNKEKSQDKFKRKDFYKGEREPEPAPEPIQSKSKASKKAAKKKEPETAPQHQVAREVASKPDKGKSAGQKAAKETIPAPKPAVQPEDIKSLSRKEQKRLRKQAAYDQEAEKARKVPPTPPTPRKPVTPPEPLSASSESSYSGSRSRSRSSEGSSRSRRRSRSRSRSPSRSLSRLGSSRSQSRSTYSGKSRSRSPSIRDPKSASKSPSISHSRSDTAMSRSTSSSSCRSSLSVEVAQESLPVDRSARATGGKSQRAIIRDAEGISTESDDEKRSSSDEGLAPSPTKKAYKKRRNSDMASLPSSRHSSCHSGKGASSSSENEKVLAVSKKQAGKDKKRLKKAAAKMKKRADKEMEKAAAAEAAAAVATESGGIPSTPSGRCDSDKSDIEMASEPQETFSEQAQKVNAELLERCRRLVINENFGAINEIMKIVGRSHSVQNGYIAIDYYRLSRMSRLRLKNFMDKVEPTE